MPRRSAQEIVDQAIRENRKWEYFSFGLYLAILVVDLVITLLMMFGNHFAGTHQWIGVTAIVSVTSGTSIFQISRATNRIREINIAIRLVESAIARGGTASEIIDIIREFLDRRRGRGAGGKQ